VSDAAQTFGAQYAALTTVDERMQFEAAQGRRERYALVDAVLDRLISNAMRGERIAKLVPPRTKKDGERVELLVSLSDEERAAVAEHFEVENQEKRGSWYVPEDEVLSLGLMHTVHWGRRSPRLALSHADAERAKPAFRGEPEAVAVWVLEPLFEELFLPLKLRGLTWLGKKTPDDQQKQWAVIDPLYEALGLDTGSLDAFRPGTGWSRHTTNDVITLRSALLESWAGAPDDVGARYRAYRLGQVIERYYAKAKGGKARRNAVLTKPTGRTLTAYFGGDWLAFLDYLGEEVDPGEEIVQALPKTKLIVGGSTRAAELAAEHGVPAEEVERMLAAFWQTSDAASPVEQRVDVLKRFWVEFDGLHARQTSGMDSLWGLVQDHSYVSANLGVEGDGDEPVHNARLYKRLLSSELQADIEGLWSTCMLPRWPDRLVTEAAPHARLAEALGPALRFWEGAALTAWFLCEGPYSRTDIDGLANYHHHELDALAELGCPVGGELFRELRAAEEKYGPPKHGTGLVITVSISLGLDDDEYEDDSRHVPFEVLRDIVTKHRREWAERHLATYLRTQWETELRAVGHAYHRHAAKKGKPPTAKQFAKAAAPAANRWFGGDLARVYGVIGVKAPDAPTRAPRLVPEDPDTFARLLYERLRGRRYELPPSWGEDQDERSQWNAFDGLAGLCVEYLQLEEALGEPPELKAFGRSKFQYRSEVLGEDVDEAWDTYGRAVHAALEDYAGASPANAGHARSAAVADGAEAVTASSGREAQQLPPAAWHPDPHGQHRWRWWDGQQWTDHVSD
jgi:Protein of unknown function (DUF2510)